MAAEGTRQRRDVRPRALTREDLVDAALRLTRRVGLNKLTMRGLADELGVTAMAAYHHVPTKDDLVQLAADALLSEVEIPAAEEGSWEERFLLLARRYREVSSAYPGLGTHLLVNGGSGLLPNGRRLVEGSLHLLAEAGFGEQDAPRAYASLHAYLVGHGVLEESLRLRGRRGRQRTDMVGRLAEELGSDESAQWGLQTVLRGLADRLDTR